MQKDILVYKKSHAVLKTDDRILEAKGMKELKCYQDKGSLESDRNPHCQHLIVMG